MFSDHEWSTTTTTTQTTTTTLPDQFSCGPRLQFWGFAEQPEFWPDSDLNGLWTWAMDSDGEPLLNDGFPYYKHRQSDTYMWWMWHGEVGHWVVNDTPGSHGADRLKEPGANSPSPVKIGPK